MKQIEVYCFSELPEDIQKKVVEYRKEEISKELINSSSHECRDSLKAFEDLTYTKAYWEVDSCNYRFNIDCDLFITCGLDDSIYLLDSSGKNLFRFIHNNIIPEIIVRKIYYKCNRRRKSNIQYEVDECCLSGCYLDWKLIEPIVDYYRSWAKYPSSFTYKDLMDCCYDSFFGAWKSEMEECESDDRIREEIIERNDLYTKTGRIYE